MNTPFFSFNPAFKDNLALTDHLDRTLTYQKLFSTQKTFYAKIQAHKKQLILILAGNNIPSVIAYLSILHHGQCALILDKSASQAYILNLLSQYQPDYIWSPENPSPQTYQSMDFSLYQYHLFRNTSQHAPIAYPPDLHLLLPTSGSTGNPKLVCLSKDSLQWNARAIAEALSLSTHDRPLAFLPLSFIYGLSVINSHLLTGSQILLTDLNITQKEFWNFTRKHQATTFPGVPFSYELLDRLRFYKMDIPSLQKFTLSGGTLSTLLLDKWLTFFQQSNKKFYNMYGQTEAGGRICILPPEALPQKKDSVGKPLTGISVQIRDDKDIPLPPNKIGEVVLQTPSALLGYVENNQDLKKNLCPPTYHYTGDMGFLDTEGFLFLKGRKSRFIKLSGKRYNLDDIEKALWEKGVECIVTGNDDELIVSTTATQDNTILQILNDFSPIHYSLVQIIKIESIPRNASGKVNYITL